MFARPKAIRGVARFSHCCGGYASSWSIGPQSQVSYPLTRQARTGARAVAVSERTSPLTSSQPTCFRPCHESVANRKWTVRQLNCSSRGRQRAPMYLRRHGLRKALVRISLALFVLFNTLDILHVRQRLARRSASLNSYQPGSERVFITGIFWNNEHILRSSLSAALVNLAEHLGPKNVFISIHESGSWDETKAALDELDEALERIGVARRISTSNVTHLDEISVTPQGEGWVDTPQGQKELRRIPYLAKQRNIGLEPLEDLSRRGIRFDKILFVNDVVFSVSGTERKGSRQTTFYKSLTTRRQRTLFNCWILAKAVMLLLAHWTSKNLHISTTLLRCGIPWGMST